MTAMNDAVNAGREVPAMTGSRSPLRGDPQRAIVGVYLHVVANYELVADNLLDLSRAAYLHPLLVRLLPLKDGKVA